MPPNPIVALLTDFGTRDSYVAQMKGVILSRCDATIVDLTHEIEPFDVFGAGIMLREAAPRFEPIVRRPIVIVAVVDPGVGSTRRILAAESGGRTFLAPDNGLLSVALDGDARIVDVIDERFFIPGGSRTFHGRDRFAPVAAALVRGTRIEELGPRVDPESIVDLGYRPPDYEAASVEGCVIRIDRFGNVVTDLVPDKLGRFSALAVRQVVVGGRARTYAERAGSDDPFVIEGSVGTLEISVANGSAARRLGARVRDAVSVTR
jgi:S-adenosyl-L-methionine hydrolase (adenosine-forming)